MLVEKFGNRFNFQFRPSPSFLFLLSLVETRRSIRRIEYKRSKRSKRRRRRRGRRWPSRFEKKSCSLCRNNNWIVIVVGDGSAHFSANYQIASAALNFALNFFSILRSRFREFLISKLEIVLNSFFKGKNRVIIAILVE